MTSFLLLLVLFAATTLFNAVARAALVTEANFDQMPRCCCGASCNIDLLSKNLSLVTVVDEGTQGNKVLRVNNDASRVYSRAAVTGGFNWIDRTPQITVSFWVKISTEGKLGGEYRIVTNMYQYLDSANKTQRTEYLSISL